MKNLFFYCCPLMMVSFFATSCKKSVTQPSYETKISFTYNGQSYTRKAPSVLFTDIVVVQGVPLFVNFTGLGIEDENNLLGGTVVILSSSSGTMSCAYLRPTGSSVTAFAPACQLQNGSNPVDSVTTYWYESGSLNFSYTDCRELTGTTVPGQKDCAVTGNFDLTLTNKNGQKIRLTNGSFVGRMKKYP
jgi:hypothetical protein